MASGRTVSGNHGRVDLAPALAWIAACLLVAVPILMTDYVPLVDLPAHMARQYIALHGDGPLSAYYQYRFAFIPNSAIDMLWLTIGSDDIVTFTRFVMAGYAVLCVTSAMVFGRVIHGAWRSWPAAAALLCYNAAFYWGFQNFVVTIPVALLAFALWIWLEDRPIWVRTLVFLPLAGFVMLMHLFGFIGLALMVAGHEIQILFGSWRVRGRRALQDGLVLSLPFLIFTGIELYEILTAAPNPNGGGTVYGSLQARLLLFPRMFLPPQVAEEPLLAISAQLSFGMVLVFTILGILGRGRLGPVLNPRLSGAALLLLLGSLAMPRLLSGVYFSDIRLPFLLFLLGFAGSTWSGPEGRGKAWIGRIGTVMIVALLCLQATAYHRFARAYTADAEDLAQIGRLLPPQARVLSVRGDDVQVASRPALWHVDALLVPLAQAYVPSLFLGVHNFVVLPQWKSSAAAQTVILPHAVLSPCSAVQKLEKNRYLQDWPRKYTHLLLVDPVDGPFGQSARLEPVATAGRFTLFQIAGPVSDAAGANGCRDGN